MSGRLVPYLVLPLLCALAACQAAPTSEGQEERLYGDVFATVAQYHLRATGGDRLAVAALGALPTIDPALGVTAAAGVVTLRSPLGEQTYRTPDVGDSAAWGRLTGRIVAAARRASPALAAVPPDRADERLIDAALGRLDRFSRYVRPEVAHERRAARDGYVGLGVTLAITPPAVRIASVLRDTPAAAAGLKPADRIVAVDGTPLARLSADAIRGRLDGPRDSAVSLEIARAGVPADFAVTVRRTFIVEDTVTLDEADGIAVIKVRAFNQRTAASAARLLARAHREMGDGLRGIVLDLRGNPGGLLDQAVDLASQFLETGVVAATTGRAPDSLQAFPVRGTGPVERLPLTVLVNGGSASAAEVVAAALQDAGRAVVIGTSSYGKGTVQTVFRTANGGELTVTWAELWAPRRYRLHRHGVVPTICTAGLDAAPEATIGAAAPAQALGKPREQLDDGAWRALRERCPPRTEADVLDLAVAKRLLGEPALYRAALLHRPAEARAAAPAAEESEAGFIRR